MDKDGETRPLNNSKTSSTLYLDGYTVAGTGTTNVSLCAAETRRRILKLNSLQISMLSTPKDGVEQGLLNEVKKMQELLQQSGDSLLALELEKLEQQQHMEMLGNQLRQKAENEEKLKEDLWNLELAKQELSQQVDDLMQSLNRSTAEQTRLYRQESETTQELEQLKATQAGLVAALEQSKQEYEQDLISLRRTVTLLKKENKKLRDMDRERKYMNERHQQSNGYFSLLEAADSTEDERGKEPMTRQHDSSQNPSQQAAQSCGNTTENDENMKRLLLELETVKTSLGHAQTMIKTLEEQLEHERQERCETEKFLLEAQETIETLQQNSQQTECILPERTILPCSDTGMSLGDELLHADGGGRGDAEESHRDTQTNINVTTVDSAAQTDDPGHQLSLPHTTDQNGLHLDRNIHVYHTRYVRQQQQQGQDIYGNKALVNPARATAFNFDPAFMDERGATMGLSQSTLLSRNGATNLIPAVTRTMMGEWVYKYTRNKVGGGISEKRHRRFFWIHPYTRTLYWSSKEPGGSGRSNAKSALILSFSVLADEEQIQQNKRGTQSEHELPNLLIATPERDIKFQCLDAMGHIAWMKSLHYLMTMNEEQSEGRKSIGSKCLSHVQLLHKSRSSLIRQTKQGLTIDAAEKRLPDVSVSSGGGEFDVELSYPFYEFQFSRSNSSKGDYTQPC